MPPNTAPQPASLLLRSLRSPQPIQPWSLRLPYEITGAELCTWSTKVVLPTAVPCHHTEQIDCRAVEPGDDMRCGHDKAPIIPTLFLVWELHLNGRFRGEFSEDKERKWKVDRPRLWRKQSNLMALDSLEKLRLRGFFAGGCRRRNHCDQPRQVGRLRRLRPFMLRLERERVAEQSTERPTGMRGKKIQNEICGITRPTGNEFFRFIQNGNAWEKWNFIKEATE